MNIKNEVILVPKNPNRIYKKVSREADKPIEKVQAEMQKALDLTWENDDPEAKEYREKMFPDGKPSLEIFLKKLAEIAKEKRL